MKIGETKRIVEYLLSTKPETRDNFNVLVMEVLKYIDPDAANEPFSKVVFEFHENGKFPPFETIRRTRQKLQEQNPYLRASEETRHLRQLQEHKFFEFAIKKG